MPKLRDRAVDQGVVGILPGSPHRRIPGMDIHLREVIREAIRSGYFLPSAFNLKSSESTVKEGAYVATIQSIDSTRTVKGGDFVVTIRGVEAMRTSP